jgi:hypothetical protein
MHPNELVNILLTAQADIQRHRDRLSHLFTKEGRARVNVDEQDAAEVKQLLDDIARDLDGAITQRSLGR